MLGISLNPFIISFFPRLYGQQMLHLITFQAVFLKESWVGYWIFNLQSTKGVILMRNTLKIFLKHLQHQKQKIKMSNCLTCQCPRPHLPHWKKKSHSFKSVLVVAFSSYARIFGGGSTNHSSSALFSFLIGGQLECINFTLQARTHRQAHSDSASWNKCGRAAHGELRVSSFPW